MSRPERSRAPLLAAAAAVVVESGLDGLRVADVAQRAGVTTGAIYGQFGSRLGLLTAVVATLFEDGSRLDESPDPVEHARRLEQQMTSQEGHLELRLEVELAGLAVREESVQALVLAGRAARLERLSAAWSSASLARAVLAVEQGWALSLALGEAVPAGTLVSAVESLVAGARTTHDP